MLAGTSLRISSVASTAGLEGVAESRYLPARGNGGCVASALTGASGISTMATYAAKRPMYKKSVTAKQRRVTSSTPPKTTPVGKTAANPKGKATAELATTSAVMWARPKHVPAAKMDPERVRHRSTAAAIAPNVSWPSATTNIGASERNQFNVDHVNPTSMVTIRVIRRALPGAGSVGRDATLPRRRAATQPTAAARVTPSRKELSMKRERNLQGVSLRVGVEVSPSRK